MTTEKKAVQLDSNEDENKKKTSFIITPIGTSNSPINREATGVIESVIVPVLNEKGFEVNNPMESTESGSIGKDIINKIVDSDLVIANLTNQNPNVMYELALRHATNKPLVMIIRSDQINQLPFDIQDQRVVTYDDTLFGLDSFKENLSEHISSAMDGESNSPVFEATGRVTLVKGNSSNISQEDMIQQLMSKVDNLNEKFSRYQVERPIASHSAIYNNHQLVSALQNENYAGGAIGAVAATNSEIKAGKLGHAAAWSPAKGQGTVK
ncbi:hypothetical protein [Levilactobacillus enshiensis]|uniref:hypothetical protein n=1 Tax=Levilactobacillus enshiensis TaxID=2590213 RepID=UPI00117A01D8|nr:hypothetical protein [Levilactobacillus enshiensis]